MKNKGMYRLLSGVLCTSVLLSSQVYAAASADYSDFPQSWSKDAMEFAVKNNFITGVSEGKIAPKSALTRAQLAAILSRAMNTGAGDVSVLERFKDANKNAWYASALAKAVELNILYGEGDSIYPDRPVTRQVLFTILARAFALTGGDESALASYSDAGSVSSWAKAAISAMIAQGYAAGYEDKTIRPTQQVTREEFAQLLYRMQDFYSSSDSSDDKTETKTEEPTKTEETTKTEGKKTSGGGGGGSSSASSGSATTGLIVNAAEAKVQNTLALGAWLPLVFEDGYRMGDVTVTADGTDVTSALTAVTTDGSIAKLPLTGTPGQVVIKSGSKTQTINLNGSGAPSVYTQSGYLPRYVLTHGAVAAWDYHLTNYDKDGKVRVSPAKTTFSFAAAANDHPSYSPDAELIQDESGFNISGNVTIMFNYNTQEEKDWFDGINQLELVQYNENKNTINANLTYKAEKDVDHYGSKVGELTIPIGQDNFRTNGRYYVRVKSAAGDSALVSIHVVNRKAPSLQTKETAVSGVNLHFNVKDMVYGITTPIESVMLKDPTGETKVLRFIDDYYLFGDLFVLYNDETAENGKNNIPYNGVYTITVRSNGFKEFSKSFVVTGGKEVSSKQAVATYQSAAYDVVTHATGGSSGGSGSDGDGGSSMVSADLLFDSDLLVNALLLDALGMETTEITKVIDHWYNMICDAVLNKGDTTYYTYAGYLDAINDAKVSGAQWLPFAEYLKGNAETTPNRPYALKEVLEDGLLGETQHSDTYGRLEAPEVTVSASKEGEDVVLSFADAAHFGKVTKLYINGNWQELSEEKYTKNAENKTITIDKSCFVVGDNTITVDAVGYVSKQIAVDYGKVLENNLSLTVKNDSPKQGDVITVAITGSEGDFLKNLHSVTLNNGKEDDSVYHKGYEGGDAVYYVIAEDKKSIELHNVKSGSYTLTIKANYYENALAVNFTVAKGDQTTEEGTQETPKFKEVTKEEPTSILGKETPFYRISFTGDNKAIETYLNAVTKVTIGGTECENKVSFSDSDTAKYKIGTDPTYGTKLFIDVTTDCFTSEEKEVVIEAKGYKNLTFRYKGEDSGNGGTEQPETKTAPVVDKIEYAEADNYYKVSFKDSNVSDYLKAITSVKVGNIDYTATEDYTPTGKQYSLGSPILPSLKLGSEGFTGSGNITVTITATGYTDNVGTYTMPDSGSTEEGNDYPTPNLTITKVKSSWSFDPDFYRLSFTGENKVIEAYLGALSKVYVGATELQKAYSFYSSDTAKYKIGTDSVTGAKLYIDLTQDLFAAGDSKEITIESKGYKPLKATFTYTE